MELARHQGRPKLGCIFLIPMQVSQGLAELSDKPVTHQRGGVDRLPLLVAGVKLRTDYKPQQFTVIHILYFSNMAVSMSEKRSTIGNGTRFRGRFLK